jgi:hypothetical protein
MSAIGLSDAEIIRCSKPVTQKRPQLAQTSDVTRVTEMTYIRRRAHQRKSEFRYSLQPTFATTRIGCLGQKPQI